MGNVELPHGYGVEQIGMKHQVCLEIKIKKLMFEEELLGSGKRNMLSREF